MRSLNVHKLFWLQLSGLYIVSLMALGVAIRPLPTAHSHSQPSAAVLRQQTAVLPPAPNLISGRPVRIMISASGIDLPVDLGYYDPQADSWTLSGYDAQFAVASTLANNQTGNTFIYGHNNNYVFGALRHHTPDIGSQLLIYTDNGRVLAYRFESATNVSPDDTSVLSYQGPPILTIQTCTGTFNEWRTMFRYTFDRVVQ